MYKKSIVLMLLLVIGSFFINNTLADNIEGSYIWSCDQSQDISKTIFVEPWEKKEICIQFLTASPTPVKIEYGFVAETWDANGAPTCDSSVTIDKNDFAKLFKNDNKREIITQNDTPATIKEKIFVPIWMAWSIKGCISYTTQSPYATWIGWMFNMVVRKVFPMSLFIWSGGSIKNSIEVLKNSWGSYSSDSKIKAIVDSENNLNLGFLIENKGNITQNIIITGKVYNFFWFQKEFSIQNGVAPWDKNELVWNIWLLPWYKWLFSVKYNITNTPSFDFDATSIDAKYKQSGYVSGNAQIYIFSWISLIIIIVFILMIFKIFWHKRVKPIQVQQTPIQ